MSEEKIKEPKPRITSWIRTNFGEDILEEIKAGKRTIKLNGTELNAKDKNFRDKRVTKTSQVEIIPEPKAITEKDKTGLVPVKPECKVYIRDFLTAEQIESVETKNANVFISGLATILDKEIQVDKDANPMFEGKSAIIKVLPQFAPG